MDDRILMYALENAVKFKGKANPGAVIGKMLSFDSSIDRKELASMVQSVVKEVNSMGFDNQMEKLRAIAPELLEKKEKVEKPKLKQLKNVKKV